MNPLAQAAISPLAFFIVCFYKKNVNKSRILLHFFTFFGMMENEGIYSYIPNHP